MITLYITYLYLLFAIRGFPLFKSKGLLFITMKKVIGIDITRNTKLANIHIGFMQTASLCGWHFSCMFRLVNGCWLKF